MHLKLAPHALAVSVALISSTALAAPASFSSARSLGMGGTGVAAASPVDAASTNPALMASDHHGWSDDFGLLLPSVNARVADKEEVTDQVDTIQDTIGRLDAAATALPANPSNVQAEAGRLRDQLQAFDQDTVRADVGVGLAVAFPGKSLSVGVFVNGNLTATVRGEFDEDDDARLEAIETGTLPPPGTPISTDLESRGRVLASAVSEVGVSFAREFELNNGEKIQVGVSPKYVNLRTFQYTETVSGFDEDEFDGSEFETEKAALTWTSASRIALARRIGGKPVLQSKTIPMDLKSAAKRPDLGEQERELTLDPRVTAGIAHYGDYHVVTAEADLTKQEGFGFESDRQWVAVGAEFDAFRYAQLRVGVRHNIADETESAGIEEGTQFTAGAGFNVFGARLDLAALYSDADVGAALELGTAF
ncbi:LOW QUALITY PROTEIN: conjugative transfer protein (plasmid) [Marinobacter adhaerens HP15]|uniref:Conjugative transfer protein n=1 Tax=Marinobacter adhaerens (strain DSM 23420 / HP15) TaxID=225937 RepID=E4PSA3_MARAH|nr:LOW QUALITY PROTEIN: conjugative transfer protein [Marinobacter adhaerens HP15]